MIAETPVLPDPAPAVPGSTAVASSVGLPLVEIAIVVAVAVAAGLLGVSTRVQKLQASTGVIDEAEGRLHAALRLSTVIDIEPNILVNQTSETAGKY